MLHCLWGAALSAAISGTAFAQDVTLKGLLEKQQISQRVYDLAQALSGPKDLDSLTEKHRMPALLMNPFLATVVTLPEMKGPSGSRPVLAGPAVHIPVQISSRSGGRPSLYHIEKDKQIIPGVYVAQDRILLRHVTRLSGSGEVTDGDRFHEEIRTTAGVPMFSAEGPIKILDKNKGIGRIQLGPDRFSGITSTDVWVIWSCIRVND